MRFGSGFEFDFDHAANFHTCQQRRSSKRNRGTNPGVDRNHRSGEIHKFLFRKMSAGLVVDLIWHVMVANLGDRFRPSEGGALSCAINWRLTPSVWGTMHPLVVFTMLARIIGMHDDAIGTAIDLRADFDEIEQLSLQAAGIDIILRSPP